MAKNIEISLVKLLLIIGGSMGIIALVLVLVFNRYQKIDYRLYDNIKDIQTKVANQEAYLKALMAETQSLDSLLLLQQADLAAQEQAWAQWDKDQQKRQRDQNDKRAKLKAEISAKQAQINRLVQKAKKISVR